MIYVDRRFRGYSSFQVMENVSIEFEKFPFCLTFVHDELDSIRMFFKWYRIYNLPGNKIVNPMNCKIGIKTPLQLVNRNRIKAKRIVTDLFPKEFFNIDGRATALQFINTRFFRFAKLSFKSFFNSLAYFFETLPLVEGQDTYRKKSSGAFVFKIKSKVTAFIYI